MASEAINSAEAIIALVGDDSDQSQIIKISTRLSDDIQSANDELEDEQAYVAAGADGSIGKAAKGGVSEILAVLGRLYHSRFGEGEVQ